MYSDFLKVKTKSCSQTPLYFVCIISFSAVGDISLNETCPCDDVKKPYNLNCNKYYECVNGDLYLKDCGTGKIFDENAQTCLPTSKAKCAPDPSFGAGEYYTSLGK